MKKIFSKIITTLFVFFMFINLAIPANAEINSKLQVNVTTEKEEYTEQEEVKYSIKLDNNYGSDLVDVKVKANIPEGIEVIDTEGKINEDTIIWQVDSMKSGEVVELKFTIKANDNKKEINVLASDNNNLSEADKITVTLASDNNNLSEVDKIPLTGGTNSSVISLIGILLVVSGGLLIFKTIIVRFYLNNFTVE